jgi:hypothetical protein
MKRFLVSLFLSFNLFANDVDLLHEALLEGASSQREKEIVQRYIDKLAEKRISNGKLAFERSLVSPGGKSIYSNLQRKSLQAIATAYGYRD